MKLAFTILILIIFSYLRNVRAQDDTISIEAINVEAYHVSSTLKAIPGSLSVLTSSNLRLYDVTSLHALNTLPGVIMQSGTYTTNRIIIRGMGSRTPYNTNRIRSYLNDIPLTTSDGLSSPEEIDGSGIARLEIIKGPSSALYGSGLGGNINLYAPVVDKSSISAGIQYGSFNTLKPVITAGYLKNNLSLWGGLSYLHSNGYRQNSRYDRASLLVTASVNNTPWKFDVLLLLLGVNSGIPSSLGITDFTNEPRSAASSWLAIEGYKKYFRSLAGVSLTRRFSENLTNKISIFGRGIDSYERRPFNNLDDRSVSAGFRNKLNLHINKTDFAVGVEWITEQYDWELDTNSYRINLNRENRKHLNVFGIMNYSPTARIHISLAAALNYITYKLVDRFPENGSQSGRRTFPLIFSPRLGLNYSLSSNWTLYASGGHGFSLPSPEETLLPAGDVNPDVRHENGWQAELGTRFNIREIFAIDAAFYWIELDNLLVTKRITEDIFTGINAGETRHRGIELMVHNRFFSEEEFPGKLSADLSYTFSSNRFVTFTDDEILYDGNHLPGIPGNTAYLKVLWNPVRQVSVFTDMRYTGNQYLNDANTTETDGYLLINLKLQAEMISENGKINLFAGINNLTDARYASMVIVNARGFGGTEPRYYYPGLPRNFYAGLNYTF